MRKILSVLLIMILLFSSAFAESAAATLQELYAQAELLMVQGDYAGAATKFETLGAYSDASQMAMYCKAIAAAESFGMYSVAVDAFSGLGDFKDSKQLAIYYSARSYESAGGNIVNADNIASVSDDQLVRAWDLLDSASKVYAELALFKDCMSRMGSCEVTKKMINTEQELRSATAQENTYQKALLLQEQGKYEDAKSLFVQLGSYKDCVDRIVQCENAIFEEHEKLLKSYYQQGETLLSEGKWEEAVAAFVKADTYSNAKERILETYYKQAETLMLQDQWDKASDYFVKAGSYKDAMNRIYEPYYLQGEKLLAAKDESGAIAAFKKAETYKDAQERYWAIYYAQGERLFAEGKWDEAAAAYQQVINYKDSESKVQACEIGILDRKYEDALEMMNAGKYSEAYAVLSALDGYKDSQEKIAECELGILDAKYYIAVELMDAGKYSEAYTTFIALEGYKDSDAKAKIAYDNYELQELKKATKGSYITFGVYEQDNNVANGKEKIEWLVLDKQNDRLFVLSRYALDHQPYNVTDTHVTWETCSLRTWLNTEFLNAAFSAIELVCIPTVTVTPDPNPSFSTNPGNATQDKVFLLSIREAKLTAVEKKCEATDYAIRRGVDVTWGKSPWYLRSPGDKSNKAAFVTYEGYIQNAGLFVDGGLKLFGANSAFRFAVRPAMWIEIPE